MVRKTVTLVFCDVADSTPLGEQLDPEALRGVWSRYHDTAREVLERHGGTIEKFVGDAVLGVFGIPVVHEDDALRAVRAAVELRGELARLNDELEAAYGITIGVRTGVHTGEVFAGDPAQGDPFATGDAVVVAQRLEATATAGEILVGDATIRLVRDAVTAEPVPALSLKGKSEPVDAWRLLDVEPDAAGVARRMDSPLVGRAAELDVLLAELEQAVSDRACRIVTIVGEPGVGKSRLAAELIATAGDGRARARGPLSPVRDGITYWPLVDVVRDVDLDADPRRRAGRRDRARSHPRGRRPGGAALAHRRALLGDPPTARDTRAQAAGRARARRHPVGGAGVPGPRRVPGRLESRRTDPRLLHGAPRSRGAPPRLGWSDDPARAAAAGAHTHAAREPGRAARRGCRRRDGTRDRWQSALPRGDAADARRGRRPRRARRPTRAARRRRRAARAGHGPGRACGPPRSARRGRACGAAAGSRDRTGLLVGRRGRPLAAGGGRRGRRPPAGARPQGADQAGCTHLRWRGRLPLRSHPDPRRRLRVDAEALARGAPRAVRRLGGGACRRRRRTGRDHRPPPRAGLWLPRRARRTRRGGGQARRQSSRPAAAGREACSRPRRHPCSEDAARARRRLAGARGRSPARAGARARARAHDLRGAVSGRGGADRGDRARRRRPPVSRARGSDRARRATAPQRPARRLGG